MPRTPTLALLLLAACTPDTDPPLPDDTGSEDTEITDDYGTVQDCTVSAAGGFGDFYDGAPTLLVYGNGERELAWAERIRDAYASYVGELELRAAADQSEGDRQLNLMIMGSPDSNPVLHELNGTLPVWFGDDEFVFGGYRYGEPGHGIALIHPSPWAPERWITLYAGNSFGGSYSTFTIPTGSHDYNSVRGRGTPQQQGDLCRDGEVWGFYQPWDEDDRATWEAWTASLHTTHGDHHDFHFVPGSEAADDMSWLADWQDTRYRAILNVLDMEALEQPIQAYLYPDNATKGEVTGSTGNAHANYPNLEVHMVYGDGVYAVGAHEDVHVLAWHRWGETNYALMGEGLAVMVDGEWWGQPLEDWVASYRDDGSLPSLTDLMDDFWSTDDTITYPVAGHFVDWLLTTWDVETVQALYLAEDLEQAFEDHLGMDLAAVEQAWLATVEG